MTTILIVDDEPAIIESLVGVLADEGYRTLAASNGAEALEIQTRQPAALILSDIMMPKLDGLGLIDRLRRQGDPTPVVLMSAGVRTPPTLSRVEFMTKPFDLGELLALVERLIPPAVGHSDLR